MSGRVFNCWRCPCIIIMIIINVLGNAMASASASVDSKAELTALLEKWETEQQFSTEELVDILTKWEFFFCTWWVIFLLACELFVYKCCCDAIAEYLSWSNEKRRNTTKQIRIPLMTDILVCWTIYDTRWDNKHFRHFFYQSAFDSCFLLWPF